MTFGPGLHVFPGGKVDPEDGVDAIPERHLSPTVAAERLGGNLPASEALAVHQAAVREVAEEVGVELAPGDLVPIALWTTPTFMARRFATWFFVADLPHRARLVFNPAEVAAHRWLTPLEALEARASGDIEMWVPTSSVLQQLASIEPRSAADVAAAVSFARVEGPRIEAETPGVIRIAVHGAGAVPGRAGETVLLGRRDLVVLDPGDPSEAAIDAIIDAAQRRRGRIRAIVLTRPDPDHAAGAEALAIPLGVPVLAAPGAGRLLPYQIVEVRDGEELPSDERLRVRLGPAGSGRLAVEAPSMVPDPFSGGVTRRGSG
jgi:8-oxo-dGTP pyrophosphatase MutT (NUDIX family)